MNSRFNTRTIVEAGMMLALAVVLGLIKPISMPFGGSVTVGSMIPLLLIAMMRGPVVGITVGVLCGVINYFLGGWLVSPVQWLLDYPLAFGALGLAGFVWNPVRKGIIKFGSQSLLAVVATIVGLGGRFICHFLSGVWFFGSFAPEGMPAWKYSLGYQASYLVPEIILSAIILFFLAPPLFAYLKNRE